VRIIDENAPRRGDYHIVKKNVHVITLVQGSKFKVRASRILSFEGSVATARKILHFVQDRL
jgi:hypothetical protein